ncbi:hypothetical protein [Methanobrevibacter cuticularis]|nr:hypothetical protein [Methanobrevibacter cuticularis]
MMMKTNFNVIFDIFENSYKENLGNSFGIELNKPFVNNSNYEKS